MAKKTNKTSHVMDLLTNGASPETAPGEAAAPEAAAGQEKSSVQSHTVTPKKVTVVDKGSRDDRVSQEILTNLTQELEKEVEESADPMPSQGVPAHPQASVPSAAASISSTPTLSAAVSDSFVPDSSELGEVPTADLGPTAQQELQMEQNVSNGAAMKVSARNIIPESLVNSNLEDGEYRFINVMELLLLRQNVQQLMEEHNVCTCERCMADVCALTLTGLPSKYVVTSKDSISPILSYYESRYKIPMLTEFMKSCSKVRERPRHKK